MEQIIRKVAKYGDSWVIKLDKQTREILKINREGQLIGLTRIEETTKVEPYELSS